MSTPPPLRQQGFTDYSRRVLSSCFSPIIKCNLLSDNLTTELLTICILIYVYIHIHLYECLLHRYLYDATSGALVNIYMEIIGEWVEQTKTQSPSVKNYLKRSGKGAPYLIILVYSLFKFIILSRRAMNIESYGARHNYFF